MNVSGYVMRVDNKGSIMRVDNNESKIGVNKE